jgi:hypothetical protein
MQEWTVETLWEKGKSYLTGAFAEGRDTPRFPFFAALSLEFIARAVVANRHPALLADPQGGDSILYAFGLPSTAQPKSIKITLVFARIKLLVGDFSDDDIKFCNFFIDLRNRELHTGDMAFEHVPTGRWLPRYYAVLAKLIGHLGHKLSDVVGTAEAEAAEEIIAAMKNNRIKEVKARIAAAAKKFFSLPSDEQDMALIQDGMQFSHETYESGDAVFRRKCPCCEGGGRITAKKIGETPERLADGEVKYQEIYTPSSFECSVCGLVLNGYDELIVEEMADQLVVEGSRDPVAYFGLQY